MREIEFGSQETRKGIRKAGKQEEEWRAPSVFLFSWVPDSSAFSDSWLSGF
jgi:hypothetical protein